MTPHEFIKKWSNSKLKERSAAQEHFLDLCRILNEPTPAEVDPSGESYGFEVGATTTTGGRGFADVFKRDHFGWEYKGTHSNLDAAFAQLQRYAVALDNPPLLIVSDIGTTIRIHTNWTNSVSKKYVIPIVDLEDAEKRQWLKWAFSEPDLLRPKKTRQELTEEVAGEFAELAKSLRSRGHKPEEVAHFINRLVFCMFAEDVKLLPERMFTKMIERALDDPAEFEAFARTLFLAMKDGGRVGFEKVAWFNGGLFNDDLVFALTKDELKIIHRAAVQYWGDIDPSILGTLFERGLDPDKRSQLGAHYTDRDKIMMIINPVIVEPLTEEWEAAKGEIVGLLLKAEEAEMNAKAAGGRASSSRRGRATTARNEAQAVLDRYLQRLADYRVLDPACGSGNFLYLALRALKDLEHRAQVEAEALGLPRRFPSIGPEVVKGIEINPYAAELARVSVWVGEIQWMLKNGFAASMEPVLKPLETIECRDALIGPDGSEAEWPKADAIVGNPPFLGDRLMVGRLGEDESEAIRTVFAGRLPRSSDLVCYWFEKASAALGAHRTDRFGFVATNSIRGGSNRKSIEKAMSICPLATAWSDEEWMVDGAAVRVSLLCFARGNAPILLLNGRAVAVINADLTGDGIDLTKALKLSSNRGVCVHGSKKIGSFDIDGEEARHLLQSPVNPNGRPNSDVLAPLWNGADIVRRPGDRWIIDFGMEMKEADAAVFERPFALVVDRVKPDRLTNRNPVLVENWWLHGGPRPAMRNTLPFLTRSIATPALAKHRLFVFVPKPVLADSQLMVVLRDDDTTFGILHSWFHEIWSLRMGTSLEDRPRYTPTTTFETFPFPESLTPDVPTAAYADNPHAIAIAAAAARLNELRENWLNPPDLVRREPEVVPGFPDRVLPVDDKAAAILKKRTLTNLYNDRPAWLDNVHKALDAAVAAAYGWPADLSDDEILARLFALNQERAAAQKGD
ncbi:class I SAM-dependent DNA methyltransferase [Jiella sonneratiae]|uniref:site-specific DNA-methyltransferase (adenine-specific) n=1 Tax=Jiella sonneratiae TaxID=2816856 RepID=A0ABS3J7V1_9HYPH|nr:DNA methyltransferase [Jiella sonneratiae]MBO0904661.1 class I SAM-dependent DNA methyltransferase [Jiella sonneratiae]